MDENEEIWTPEEESAELAKRFEGVNQASFARKTNFPGGASMINQHVKGRRPINLQHALAYAEGFEVSVREISPRLAHQAETATSFSDKRGKLIAHSAGTGKSLNIPFFLEGISEGKTILILTDKIKAHSPTRREIIGNLLNKLALDPENLNLVEELELQLHAPTQQSETSTTSAAPSSTFGSPSTSTKSRKASR